MKKRSFLSTVVLMLAAVACLAGGQVNMHDAIDSLHKAKTSMHPQQDLEAAKQSLKQAKHDKAGFRVAAIQLIDQAMSAYKAGDRIGADKLVTEAINKLEKGVGAGHR